MLQGAPRPTRNSAPINLLDSANLAAVAQLVEHMICNLEVVGSSPIGGFSPFASA